MARVKSPPPPSWHFIMRMSMPFFLTLRPSLMYLQTLASSVVCSEHKQKHRNPPPATAWHLAIITNSAYHHLPSGNVDRFLDSHLFSNADLVKEIHHCHFCASEAFTRPRSRVFEDHGLQVRAKSTKPLFFSPYHRELRLGPLTMYTAESLNPTSRSASRRSWELMGRLVH